MSIAPITLHARSFCLPAGDETPHSFVVFSVHRRVLNLADDRGRIIAIVAPEVGDGPFHIVLQRAASFDFARPGDAGVGRGKTLTLGERRIDWSQARPWDASLRPGVISAQALALLTDFIASSPRFGARWAGMDARTIARMQRGAALLRQGGAGDALALEQGVARLMGLGPGLTPAGDDCLLGALAHVWMIDAPVVRAELSRAVEQASAATTRISRAWLAQAALGRFDARWHTLQRALVAEDEKAIHQAANAILAVGATSGPQAIAGFLVFSSQNW